ncbi:tyrosine-type recombinase/integrase [Phenylobacterium sp. 58.2.17]|uniref:tyrosine-type recombinase/integrase n=1 Tax=Phenylobacterium sp. 58.2.17 TaxID=2969306 RepID=UPI0022646EC1|nr:site-specific integrase [Phenylobacterium sp. 58.2.17]MCX7584877.1 site-specific integrase [Phenylobacterium sp. 58.2.17]
MAVYRPAKSRFFHYDFIYQGHRFHGSTGCETLRKAQAVERKVRDDAALGLLDDAAQLTLDEAAGRWWSEKGRHLRTAAAVERRLERLLVLFAPGRRIAEIATPDVLSAMQTRRAQRFVRSDAPSAQSYAVSNRTVNLEVIDTLRPILRRARRAWGAKALPEIDWGELRLPEPKPKRKEFADAELTALLAALAPHWRDFVRIASTYGCRLEEMFFKLSALDLTDPASARVTLRERKNDQDHVIPLLAADAGMLRRRAERARAAGLDTVWHRELAGGQLHALSYHGAASAIRRAITATGLRAAKGMKGAHDLRRHSGMRILRATGNLRVAQRLLGHASIQSTLVYAHAVESDLRAGLEQLTSSSSPGPDVRPADAHLPPPHAHRDRRDDAVP